MDIKTIGIELAINNLDILIISNILILLFGVSIIITKNPLYSVGCLILVFLCVSINLAYLGLTYISLTYLIVYIGAVAILFMFVIIILDLRYIYQNNNNLSKNIPLILLLFLFFILSLNFIIPSLNGNLQDVLKEILQNLVEFFGLKLNGPVVYFAYIDLADNLLANIGPIQIIGVLLYNSDLLLFIIVILLFLIGALTSKLITK
jgi:NADH-ubiquinone oxidoreductase chain 6